MSRYAIYAMPPMNSALWQFGSSVLGYDAATGLDVPFPDHPVFADPLSLAWSAEPRRYGFHATLKAPFHLADGIEAEDLTEEAIRFAASKKPFSIDLTLAPVGHFLALVAPDAPAELGALADACVRHFDPFRQPLSAADRERRHPENLIERQVQNLDTWGYPYVFEDFQFHMTLTGSLEPDDRHRIEPVLRELLMPIPLTTVVDAIAVFRQDDPEGRFVVHQHCPFAS